MKNPIGDNIKDFKLLDKIGSGGFAEVFKAKCLQDGYEDHYVAIKRISKDLIFKKKCEQRVKAEIEIHSELSHPNIVKFHTSFEDNKYWYLVLDLCGRGSFEEYVKRKQHLHEDEACRLIKQVINALQYLQLNEVIHRDLSLKNILLAEDSLTGNLTAKIIDFGLASKCRYNEKLTANVGTAKFMPPEVFEKQPYDFKVDCWSAGCILYALLYGAPPFDGKKRESIKYHVVNSELTFPDWASKEAIDLLKNMLMKNQKDRIEIKNALHYAFFQKYEKSSKKYEINSQRSGDSGLNSLSSSRSASSRSSRKSERTVDRERKNNCENKVYNENYSCEFSSNLGMRRSQSRDHSNSRYQRAKSPCKPKQKIRFESQCELPTKCLPETPRYPHYARYLTEAHTGISSDNSCHNGTDNNKKYESRGQERNVITRTNSYDNIPKYSCNHDEYCLPEKNCCHKSSCCQSSVPIHQNSSIEHHSHERERKQDVEIRNSSEENGLESVTTPLSTVRLKPSRYTTKNLIVSILNDGQACVEFLKLKKKKKYVVHVCFVSWDGQKIIIFKPKKKILPSENPPPLPKNTEEVQYYSFRNLPKIHWKKYQYAKRFVDIKRAQTPKITEYGKEAKFVLMENAPFPDFEANFYNGYQIRESGDKITVIDQNGIRLTDEKKLDAHVEFLLNTFKHMKEKFCILERNLENLSELHESLGITQFPVTYGRRPDSSLRNSDDSKENASPRSMYSSSLNGTIAMKSYSGTINTDCSPLPNTSPASMPSPLSNRKGITTEKNITDILPTVKSQPSVLEDWVVADYTDDVQMWISMRNKDPLFFNIRTRQPLSTDEHPDLMKRFCRDVSSVIRDALSEQVKRTK